MATDILVPTLGESVSEATVAQWLKKAGDAVSPDEPLVELETDKVTLEVNAPVTGVLSEIKVTEGTTVGIGTVLAIITGGGAPAAATAAAPQAGPDHGTLSPAVRKILAEHKIDPARVPGSGKGGRITTEDVVDFLEKGGAAAAPVPTQAPTQEAPTQEAPAPSEGFDPDAVPRSGPGGRITRADLQGVLGTAALAARAPAAAGPREERVRMTKLRQTIARRLKDAQNTAAMLTTFNEVDMSAVMDLRKQYKEVFEKRHGVRLGFMGFFVKACIQALREIPDVNAEIDGADLIYKDYYHVGIAGGTDRGLVVPVVRDADRMGLADIEKTITDFGQRARDGKLSIEEMQGGTFTITNGGVYGSLMSTPILNAPQSGILGMHKIQERPMAVDGEIKLRPMMYLALSYDHRVVDGKGAVTFLVRVKESLEDPQRLMLDL